MKLSLVELEAFARRIDIGAAQDSPNDSPDDSPDNSPDGFPYGFSSSHDSSYNLWTSARSKIRNILKRFPDQPLEEIEFDLHDLWDTFIRAAIITDVYDPAQDRLVMEVVLARELGSLGPNAVTADGEVMSGLPFLVRDLTPACSGKLMPLEPQERLNLAAFAARLLAAGVRAPELGFCALSVLRETFETRINTNIESDDSISKLLPVALAWLDFAGQRLAVFSGGNGHEPLSGEGGTLTAVGPMARNAGILEPGFSTKRWRFWRQRLEVLSVIDADTIKKPALLGMKSMDMWSEDVGLVVER